MFGSSSDESSSSGSEPDSDEDDTNNSNKGTKGVDEEGELNGWVMCSFCCVCFSVL